MVTHRVVTPDAIYVIDYSEEHDIRIGLENTRSLAMCLILILKAIAGPVTQYEAVWLSNIKEVPIHCGIILF